MAVVGLHFGKWLIDNEIIKGYAAPYFELAAVCDQNEVLAHACAREYHVKAYTRLEDALADRDIDLVTLVTYVLCSRFSEVRGRVVSVLLMAAVIVIAAVMGNVSIW